MSPRQVALTTKSETADLHHALRHLSWSLRLKITQVAWPYAILAVNIKLREGSSS